MLTLLPTLLPVFAGLTFLCLMLSTTASMRVFGNFKTPDSLKTEASKENLYIPTFNKREISGADPWSLCPNSMERVDCFLEYLRVYARLRKATSGSNSVSVRNIGKRSSYTTTRPTACPAGISSGLCFLIHLNTSMKNIDAESDGRGIENNEDFSR